MNTLKGKQQLQMSFIICTYNKARFLTCKAKLKTKNDLPLKLKAGKNRARYDRLKKRLDSHIKDGSLKQVSRMALDHVTDSHGQINK